MLQHFSEMLGLQHLDVPHLRGRTGLGTIAGEKEKEKETGGTTEKKGAKSIEEVGTSDRFGQATTVIESRRSEPTGR